MQRLFVAIDLPEAIKAQLKPLCTGLDGAKWVSYQQMHLTLRFIGDADESQQTGIQTGLATIHATPFKMGLTGVGQFPSKGKPRVLWVGIEAEAGLNPLQQKIERIIREVGSAPDDHSFSPHITLARFKMSPSRENMQHYMERHQSFRTETFDVKQFILYSSQLTPSGSIYHHEAEFPLA
jgi:2'-5' RNA ligase